MKGPLVLCVLDGWGHRDEPRHNAILQAPASYYLSLRDRVPWTQLTCSGREVGLPLGLMGNSEVGHMNLGAGSIVWQEITRIDRAIETREFRKNAAFRAALEHVQRHGSRLHLLGLVSDGGVHSSDRHLVALLELAKESGLDRDQVAVHAFLDGRDTPPRSGATYLEALERELERIGVGRIATLCGRYYAMDRDKRWDRVELAYRALVDGEGRLERNAVEATRAAYAREETDEFVKPIVLGERESGRIRKDDAVIFFNFRADRARQLTEAFTKDEFEGFERRSSPRPLWVTMTSYREDFDVPVAFPPQVLRGILPEILAARSRPQLRIAETEKYAHVTFFFSGGRERPYEGEERILIPSPKVATYDLQPAMSAMEVTDRLLQAIESERFDFILCNFANADMVGHTGKIDAAMEAVRTIDACLARIVPLVEKKGGVVAITADHGNAEMMWDDEHDEPHTAHTTLPVDLVFACNVPKGTNLRPMGILADVAPTLLQLMEIEVPAEMDGRSLIVA